MVCVEWAGSRVLIALMGANQQAVELGHLEDRVWLYSLSCFGAFRVKDTTLYRHQITAVVSIYHKRTMLDPQKKISKSEEQMKFQSRNRITVANALASK